MRIRACVACLVLATPLLGGCGNGDANDEARVTAAVEALQRDMAAGRIEAVCTRLAERPRRQIGSVGHGRRPTTCERDVRELVSSTDQAAAAGLGLSLRSGPKPRVVDVAMSQGGEMATATLAIGGETFDVPLVRRGDDWLLADFFGAQAPAPKELQ